MGLADPAWEPVFPARPHTGTLVVKGSHRPGRWPGSLALSCPHLLHSELGREVRLCVLTDMGLGVKINWNRTKTEQIAQQGT